MDTPRSGQCVTSVNRYLLAIMEVLGIEPGLMDEHGDTNFDSYLLGQEDYKFKACLNFRMSSRPAWANSETLSQKGKERES